MRVLLKVFFQIEIVRFKTDTSCLCFEYLNKENQMFTYANKLLYHVKKILVLSTELIT